MRERDAYAAGRVRIRATMSNCEDTIASARVRDARSELTFKGEACYKSSSVVVGVCELAIR